MGVCCPCPYPCRPCPGGVGSCPAHPAAVGGARATPLAVVGKLPPFSPALLAWLLVLAGDGVDAVDNHCNTPVTAFFAFLTTSVGLNCAISVTKACTIGFFSLSFASLSFAFWMAQVRQTPRLCTALSHPCGVLDEPLHRPFAPCTMQSPLVWPTFPGNRSVFKKMLQTAQVACYIQKKEKENAGGGVIKLNQRTGEVDNLLQ